MNPIDLALVIWFAGSVVFLFAVEALTAVLHVPSISQRMHDLGKNATIVVIWSTFVIGYLLAHFWDQWAH